MLPWQTLHNLRAPWTGGIIVAISCLLWIFLPQAYLLFILTVLPASISRCSPCSCFTGGSKGSFPLHLLLCTVECIDIFLPCSQLKGNCQPHPSIPHFTNRHSPSSSHNTHAVLLQPSAHFCHDERSLQLVLKANIFPLLFLVKIHIVQEITYLLFLPFQSLLKYSPWGVTDAASYCTGPETFGQKTRPM